MNEIAAMGAVLTVLFYLVLIVLIPVMLYTAQKWAYKCYKELREIRRHLEGRA